MKRLLSAVAVLATVALAGCTSPPVEARVVEAVTVPSAAVDQSLPPDISGVLPTATATETPDVHLQTKAPIPNLFDTGPRPTPGDPQIHVISPDLGDGSWIRPKLPIRVVEKQSPDQIKPLPMPGDAKPLPAEPDVFRQMDIETLDAKRIYAATLKKLQAFKEQGVTIAQSQLGVVTAAHGACHVVISREGIQQEIDRVQQQLSANLKKENVKLSSGKTSSWPYDMARISMLALLYDVPYDSSSSTMMSVTCDTTQHLK